MPRRTRTIMVAKIAFFLGIVLGALGTFLLIYQPYTSEAIFHLSEPQYAVKFANFEITKADPNTAEGPWMPGRSNDQELKLTLQILDRAINPQFEKFRALQQLSFEDRRSKISLYLIQRDGTYKTVTGPSIATLLNAQPPQNGQSTMVLRFRSPDIKLDEAFEKISLQLPEFSPLVIASLNPLVRYFPAVSFVHPVLLVVIGAVAMLVGGSAWYDSRPIPDEYIAPPEPLLLTQDEAWRKKTGFRYLERLKQAHFGIESRVLKLHEEGTAAHRKLPQSSGYIEYGGLRRTINNNIRRIEEYLSEMGTTKDHIEKVFAGDVRSDVLALEENLQKIKRVRQDNEAALKDSEQEIAREQVKERRRLLEDVRINVRRSLKRNDMDIIEIESVIKELREFDFQNLYKELGVSPETMRADAERLDEIKKKAGIVAEIKPQNVVGQKTEDERKMDAAGQRIKYDIRFNVEQRLGKNITTLEEIQRFYKEREGAIKNNPALSYDEKTEQLAQLARDCEEYKKELKTDVNIYEED